MPIRANLMTSCCCEYWSAILYIYNPILRQKLSLPDPPRSGLGIVHGHGLVFQAKSCKAHIGCTLNFDQFKYRLVLIRDMNVTARIFFSETRKWRKLAISFPPKVTNQFGYHPVACDRILYWLDGVLNKFHGIVAFVPFNDTEDADKLRRYIDLPLGKRDRRYVDKLCFGACLGWLWFSHLCKRKVGYFALKIWELNYDENGFALWNLVSKLPLRRVEINKIIVLAFHPNNGDDIFVLCDHQFCNFEIRKLEFEDLGQWPGDMVISKYSGGVSTYSLVHSPWPTPIEVESIVQWYSVIHFFSK